MSDTPETDALAENLIPIVKKITEFNAQYVIKQILTEILTKTTKMERERDEANEELHKQLVRYDQLFDEAEKIRIERDEAREELEEAQLCLKKAITKLDLASVEIFKWERDFMIVVNDFKSGVKQLNK